MTRLPPGYNPDDLPGQIVDEGWYGRIVDPETGAGEWNANSDPNLVGPDPITGEDAPLGTDVGFGSATRRYMISGIYNSDFAVPPRDPSAWIDDDYNLLPYWSFTPTQSGCIRAMSTADDTAPAGRSLCFHLLEGGYEPTTGGGGVGLKAGLLSIAATPWAGEVELPGDDAYIEQIIPVVGSKSQGFHLSPSATFAKGSTANAPGASFYLRFQYLKPDLSTTGDEHTLERSWEAMAGDDFTLSLPSTQQYVIPELAYYARLRIGVKRNTAVASTFGTIHLVDCTLSAITETAVIDNIYPTLAKGNLGRAADPWTSAYIDDIHDVDAVHFANATTDSSTDALDHYIDHTSWTPALEFGGGTTGLAYTEQAGRYHRIGSMLVCSFRLELSSKGSSTGTARLTGLPVVVGGDTEDRGGAVLPYHANMSGITGNISLLPVASDTDAVFYESGGTDSATLDDTAFTNTSVVRGVITYWTSP